MKTTKTVAAILSGLGIIAGIAGTVALQTHAQTTDTTSTGAANAHAKPHGHAPLGGDGIITAINGSAITIQEEADEGGASYDVDTSQATITDNGATAALSDLKDGDKIFVHGTTTGTNVTATSISLGHPGPGDRGPEHTDHHISH